MFDGTNLTLISEADQDTGMFALHERSLKYRCNSPEQTQTRTQQEISLKKIFGGSQILTILTQLSHEIPLYSLSLHAGKGCSV